MHQRKVTPIAGGVQGGRRLRQVLADDAGVADLFVAKGELVVGEADGARIVRQLGMLQGARVQRDRTRLLAAGEGDAAVQTPERRDLRVGNLLAQGVGRAAEDGRRLYEVVLQQPGFGQRGADDEFVFTIDRAAAQHRPQNLGSLGPAAAFERGICARDR